MPHYKPLTGLIIILLLSLWAFPQEEASAALTAGVYPIDGTDGSWIEFFPDGVGVASSANVFNTSGTPWIITANIKKAAQPITNPDDYSFADAGSYDFYTVYNVIYLFINKGPWGDPITLGGIEGEMYSTRDSYPSGDIAFTFLSSGIYGIYQVDLAVSFDSIIGSGNYTYAGNIDQHQGQSFDEIELTIMHTPVPSAAWLLCTGLVGLNWLRKRR